MALDCAEVIGKLEQTAWLELHQLLSLAIVVGADRAYISTITRVPVAVRSSLPGLLLQQLLMEVPTCPQCIDDGSAGHCCC